MSTLAEIEHAALQLPPQELLQLVNRLASALDAADKSGTSFSPEPRRFSSEQIAVWIAEDERDMEAFRAGR